jgi:predicted ATPase/class 3 adenylate cyclase
MSMGPLTPASSVADGGVSFILYTDIYQSSRLAERYPEDYPAALSRHNVLTEAQIDVDGGELYRHTGDGYIAFFGTADDCLRCALALQAQYAKLPPISADRRLQVRVVAHGGPLHRIGGHYFSPAFNRADRICQACHPGQVLISAIVHDRLGPLPAGAELIDLGTHHLRDLAEPERLYQVSHPDLGQTEFPPLPTLSSRPNNLPAQPNSFFGREREIAEIKALIRGGARGVTLVAPGGYGKSRLAAHLCAELLPEFERGVFQVDLESVAEPGAIATALAQALTFRFYGGSSPLEQLVDYLREKELLLCFDNFEHLAAGAPVVAEILRSAPRVSALVTSREALRITGEQVYPLDPLPVAVAAAPTAFSDAELLFADRASLVNPGFRLDADSAPAVRAICAKLNGVPLAIELAAAWADTITLAELDSELEQQLELTARHADVPARHTSLRASLDWSWQLLSAQQREQLMRLSAFRSGCFAPGASAVLELAGPGLRRRLAALIDKSWLKVLELRGETRYVLRDAVSHEYASEKLREQPALSAAAVLAQAGYIAILVEDAGRRLHGPQQLAALEELGLELPNIHLALEELLARAPDAAAEAPVFALLTTLLGWLGEYLYRIGEYRDLLARYQPASSALIGLDSGRRPAFWASLHLGRALSAVGERRSAGLALQTARSLAEQLGESPLLARAFYELSSYHSALGEYDRARELCEASLAIRRERNSRSGIASCLGKLGTLEQLQGNLDAALEYYQQALELSRELGDISTIAALLRNLAAKARARRRYDEALALYGEALELARQLGSPGGIGRALNNLGILYQAQRQPAAARSHYLEALEIFREIGDRTNLGHTLGNLAMLAQAEDQIEPARDYYRQALTIVRETGTRGIVARLANNLGTLEQDQGNLHAARELYAEALSHFRDMADLTLTAITLNNLGIVEQLRGQAAAARDYCREALAIRRETADESGLRDSLAAAGHLLSLRGAGAAAALALYGAHHHSAQPPATLQPLERQLLEQGLAAIEHPETGLPAAERERLKSQAAAMSPDELAKFAQQALAELELE